MAVKTITVHIDAIVITVTVITVVTAIAINTTTVTYLPGKYNRYYSYFQCDYKYCHHYY